MTKPTMYLLFGAQGSGKSTQGEILAKKLGLPEYNSGNEIRKFLTNNTEESSTVRQITASGGLIDSEIVLKIFRTFINENDTSHGIVLDGLPRTQEQCPLVEGIAEENGWTIIAVYIKISDETAKKRISTRTVVIDGKETVREDDQPEILEKRLATFKAETLPVLEWFKNNHTLVTIDGEPPIEEVTQLMIRGLGVEKDNA